MLSAATWQLCEMGIGRHVLVVVERIVEAEALENRHPRLIAGLAKYNGQPSRRCKNHKHTNGRSRAERRVAPSPSASSGEVTCVAPKVNIYQPTPSKLGQAMVSAEPTAEPLMLLTRVL